MTNFSVPSWTYLHDLSSHEDTYLQIIRRVLASGRLLLGPELHLGPSKQLHHDNLFDFQIFSYDGRIYCEFRYVLLEK